MAAALLDVNVLVALAWPSHTAHAAAHAWFGRAADRGWATTPITECGFVRVSSNRAALPLATAPGTAARALRKMAGQGRHEFWPDDVAWVVGDADPVTVATHAQVTDAHLVALARAHAGRLVTFDAPLSRRYPDLVELLTVV